MRNYSQNLMKLAVGLTILIGVLIILLTNEKSFKKIVSDDVENISRLSSSILYAEIDNSLTQPVFVGLTMANDAFLKNWLRDENPEEREPEQTAMMRKYLAAYRKKYGYDSVFMISTSSGVYYYQEGVNKIVSRTDPHDVWYFDLLDSDALYKMNVDTDEAHSDVLTVFADSKILDEDGSVMGVVGVGIKMSHLQELLLQYESTYDLQAFLMNEEGLIQVDSDDTSIETRNFFDQAEMGALQTQIIDNKDEMQIFWYPEDGSDHCLITKYIKNLDWYLVIEKNTAQIQQLLNSQINRDLLLIGVIILLVLAMISWVLARYNRVLLRTASLDEVTNLPNKRMFHQIFDRNTKRPACNQGAIFLFDIDAFKEVNDRFGHLFGNTVLYHISEIAKTTVASSGVVARWGGDEFVGVIYGTRDEVEELLRQMVQSISAMREGELGNITVSVGVTMLGGSRDLEALFAEADQAMYRSKNNGKNQTTFF